jgi:hypothetical protein
MRFICAKYLSAVLLSALLLSGCARQIALGPPEALNSNQFEQRHFEERANELGAKFAESAHARDCTGEFRTCFDAFQAAETHADNSTHAAAGDAHVGDLSGYHVIVVHGLLGEVGLKFTHLLNQIDSEQSIINYLKDQEQALRRAGADVEMLDHKSDSVEHGGAEVARRILASDRPVLIVSHSKGGLDTLEALMSVQREGKLSKVAGWIAIQAPFRGAPEADEIAIHKMHRIGAKIALKCLGARFDAVNDMSTTVRGGYLDAHRDEIDRIVAQVPIISFASWIDDPSQPVADTDGSVPLESAILPGSSFILVGGVSHAATVFGGSHEFDRTAFTCALMKMLLERVAVKPQ